MTDAAALHRAILTLDSHIDIPWPTSPDPFGPTDRHVDLPKMRDGGLDAGCFVAFVPQGARTQAGCQEAWTRACAMLDTIRAMDATRERHHRPHLHHRGRRGAGGSGRRALHHSRRRKRPRHR